MRSLPRMPALRRTATDSRLINNCVICVPPGARAGQYLSYTEDVFRIVNSRGEKARMRDGSEVLGPQLFRKKCLGRTAGYASRAPCWADAAPER
jgi:hypothetical protein